jgi:predicted aminopeptidase
MQGAALLFIVHLFALLEQKLFFRKRMSYVTTCDTHTNQESKQKWLKAKQNQVTKEMQTVNGRKAHSTCLIKSTQQ